MSRKKKNLLVEPRKGIQLSVGEGKKGNFLTTTWLAISPSSEITRSESFWHVRSNVRIEVMLKFLRLRFFWEQAEELEKEFSFSHPGFLKDMEFNVLLALLTTTELSRSEIIGRMEKALKLIGLKSNFSLNLISQWNNHILITADLESRTIRPHKAYSGWVRNASSVGSKRGKPSAPEPISEDMPEDKFDKYNFLYELISVGRIETNSGVIRLP